MHNVWVMSDELVRGKSKIIETVKKKTCLIKYFKHIFCTEYLKYIFFTILFKLQFLPLFNQSCI